MRSKPVFKRLNVRSALATVAGLVLMTAGCAPGEGKVAFVGGTLWDGTGAPPILDAVIIVSGGTVEAAGPPDLVKIPRGATVRRLDGKWIIPGLIDAHAHLERWMAAPMLASGITAVRDAGGHQDSVVALRDEISINRVLGPRFFIAGAEIDAHPSATPHAQVVGSPVEARRAIDDRLLIEASHAMISPKLGGRFFTALMSEAEALHVPVAAHLGKMDAITAAKKGIVAIEHLSGVVEASVRDPSPYYRAYDAYLPGWKTFLRGWTAVDSASLERTAVALAATEVFVVPTLVHQEAFSRLRDAEFVSRVDMSTVPQWAQDRWEIPQLIRRARITSRDFAAFTRGRAQQDLFVRRFVAAGGSIAAGSNTPNALLPPGSSLHEELRLLSEAGVSPRRVLLAATRDAARLLRADTLGVIEAGNVADFVVLNGDPLQDIRHTRDIDLVVYRGFAHYPSELR